MRMGMSPATMTKNCSKDAVVKPVDVEPKCLRSRHVHDFRQRNRLDSSVAGIVSADVVTDPG